MSTPPASHSSAPDKPDRAAVRARREQRLVAGFFAFMLVFGLACWFAFPHVTPIAKGWLARRHLPTLRQHLKAENWQQAAAALREARSWANNDPAVIHAALEFIASIGGDPRSTINLVHELQAADAATPADLSLMGKMHLQLGETDKARAIYAELPASTLQQRESLELHAGILQADGFFELAAASRRAALKLTPDDPNSLRQLAAMDLADSDPARRRTMREHLWRQAHSGSAMALTACELLAGSKDLTVPQADELLHIVATVQATSAVREATRFRVLSAQLRLSPHLRTDFIDQEVARWKDSLPAQITPLVAWLAEEQEHARILRMLPARTAAHHTDLLPHYVNALRGEKKWPELHTLLVSGGIDPAFSPQRIRLWLAEVQSHLQPDLAHTRQTLARIYEEAGRGKDLATTLQAGQLAEQLSQWDLAQKCYAAVASKHTHLRRTMLAKLYQMAEAQRDGHSMLAACTQWLAAEPDNPLLVAQKFYLQFLLGIELETAQRQLQNHAPSAAESRAELLHLCRALAAYRHGQPEATQKALTHVTAPAALPAGQRAVYAALLKQTGGDVGTAFRLVERVPPLLLLPEEQVFLRRAL